MKYLVFSDIHGSKFYAEKMKNIIDNVKPDKLILLGDLYYHGPRNSLPKDYAPAEVCNILNNYKDIILCCKGNCDAEVDEMISNFEFKEEYVLNISGKRVMFTHGHRRKAEDVCEDIDILIYGHFHTGFIKQNKGVLCINSGSISLPKENTPNSYLLIENDVVFLKDLDNNIISKVEIK